jgi:hypothetical protein
MATNSILKDININSKRLGRSFVSALENAENKKSKEVVLSKACTTIRKDQIKALFEVKK